MADEDPPQAPDRRREILTPATEAFGAHGCAGMSMPDPPGAVGIRKASLLHHFPSKGALVIAPARSEVARAFHGGFIVRHHARVTGMIEDGTARGSCVTLDPKGVRQMTFGPVIFPVMEREMTASFADRDTLHPVDRIRESQEDGPARCVRVEVRAKADLRAWLAAHHAQEDGV